MSKIDPVKLLKELERRIATRKLFSYKPLGLPETLCPDGEFWKKGHNENGWTTWSNKPWQLEFHNRGKDHQERLLICANRVGKCITNRTHLELYDGGEITAIDLYNNKDKITLKSWDGSKIVPGEVIGRIKKDPERCFRIWLSNGQWFECAANHRVLTVFGWRFVEQLLANVTNLPASNSEHDLITHVEDIWHWLEKPSNSQRDWGFSSLISPNKSANNIIAYQDIGVHDIYDFTINQWHNYITRNVVHHNTHANLAEVAIHMTGTYPNWWDGKRFDNPVLVWSGSPTNETSRDIVQKGLLGGTDKENLGTGWIPKDLIIGRPKMKQAGVSDVVDTFKVRHKSGGVSICVLKTYEQGWRKWQGTAPDVVSLDEEPEDFKIYTEALTRVLTSRGDIMTTFTPLLGQTDLVLHFEKKVSGQYVGTATWEDAPHLNREERERMAAAYPDHEVQARTMGVPMMGEGRIFKQNEDEITIEHIDILPHWPRINGLDFGMDHPYGYAAIAWDRSKDVIYVYDCQRETGGNIPQHAAILKRHGAWIPVSWPHDGLKRTQGVRTVGPQIFRLYSAENVNMLSRSARYQNDIGGAQDQWIVIEEIKERERTGRIKYFKSCTEILEERRNYHTKDGKIVSVRDDTIKALFYAVMMKRYATTNFIHEEQPQAAIISMRH